MTRPNTWIWPAVNGNRETATAFNLLVNLPDRALLRRGRDFGRLHDDRQDLALHHDGHDAILNRPTGLRCRFGNGSLEFHCIEPGLDEWIGNSSDEDKYSRLFEVCATLGYVLTDPHIGTLGGAAKRRRLIMYPSDQGNLLTCANASQVADHALKSNYDATVFTKLDQADFMNRHPPVQGLRRFGRCLRCGSWCPLDQPGRCRRREDDWTQRPLHPFRPWLRHPEHAGVPQHVQRCVGRS